MGKAMVEITDLSDATVHRRHIDQIHFRESSTPEPKTTEEEPDDSVHSSQPQHTEDDVNPAEEHTTTPSDEVPLALRRPVRRASQFDEALLREESCGELTTRGDPIQGTNRYSFQTCCQTPDPISDIRPGTPHHSRTTNGKPVIGDQ